MELKSIYMILLALCLVILLLRIKKIPTSFWWFIPMLTIAIGIEFLKDGFPENKFALERIYQPMECFLLLGFYSSILNRARNKKIIVVAGIIYLVAVLLYYFVYKSNKATIDYFDFILQAFIICILVVLFFFELLDQTEDINLMTYGAFWINAANFIFYGGCFFIMAYYEKISNTQTMLAEELRQIPKYLNLFLYTIYALVFALAKKNTAT